MPENHTDALNSGCPVAVQVFVNDFAVLRFSGVFTGPAQGPGVIRLNHDALTGLIRKNMACAVDNGGRRTVRGLVEEVRCDQGNNAVEILIGPRQKPQMKSCQE